MENVRCYQDQNQPNENQNYQLHQGGIDLTETAPPLAGVCACKTIASPNSAAVTALPTMSIV